MLPGMAKIDLSLKKEMYQGVSTALSSLNRVDARKMPLQRYREITYNPSCHSTGVKLGNLHLPVMTSGDAVTPDPG